ncbi:MAG: hypothetical protein BAJALOKI3v1_190045 [Promethearchaeota archaeon]|nr:MAG: hypothetical protein BAJALOKI3v1_190045 [Candidatus Lokiarchaeota archaeon]
MKFRYLTFFFAKKVKQNNFIISPYLSQMLFKIRSELLIFLFFINLTSVNFEWI